MKIYEKDANGNLKLADSKRIRFATDNRGELVEEYEEFTEYANLVADNVHEHFRGRAEKAREQVRKKKSSPIEYFMYKIGMEIDLLMALTGFTRREVNKHMKPHVFEKLNNAMLQRYAKVFETDIDTIKSFKG